MTHHASRERSSYGFSLIELLVAMAIGLILTLAITSVLIRSEGSKRSTTSVNDINQSGSYAAYVLDRYLRSAGSGYAQSWATSFGCLLQVAKSGTDLLPMPGGKPPAASTFANVDFPIRLAPLVIAKDAADTGTTRHGDVLMVMSGTAGVGEAPQSVTPGSISPNMLGVPTTLGWVTNDMLLLATSSMPTCSITQVGAGQAASSAGQSLPLDSAGATGTYYKDPAGYDNNGVALQLGREGVNPPEFKLFGVSTDNALTTYDLLSPPTSATVANETTITDGVSELHAVYGIDTGKPGVANSPPDGIVDVWVAPTGEFSAAKLMDGSKEAQTKLRQIIAVRVGLILRTSLPEKETAAASGVLGSETFVSTNPLRLFSDLAGMELDRTPATAQERSFRYRTVEITVPLRNVLMAPET